MIDSRLFLAMVFEFDDSFTSVKILCNNSTVWQKIAPAFLLCEKNDWNLAKVFGLVESGRLP